MKTFSKKLDQKSFLANTKALTLAGAHSQIFEKLDEMNVENSQDLIRILRTRLNLWLDTLQFALDDARNRLQELQKHHDETSVDLTLLCTTVSQKFFHTLKECGLAGAECFMFLQKFDKEGEHK